MMFSIEFRSGSYLKSEADEGGPLDEARRWATREEAESHLNQNSWLVLNGGMVVKVEQAPPTKTYAYKPGDIVCLKSEGPDMTVNSVLEGRMYVCVWIIDGRAVDYVFHEDALVRILGLRRR